MTDQQNSSSQDEQKQIEASDDLAIEAVSEATKQVSQSMSDTSGSTSDSQQMSEAEKSDEFADTLHSLEKVIESKASKLMQLKQNVKHKSQMIKNVFENDVQLAEAEEQKSEVQKAWKERKAQVSDSSEVRELKQEIKEMRQNQKDLEESLSNHLINYHQLTNSTSFDTSDGDQWEFNIKAKVKTKKM